MKVGILGGGFGLYGYLPALLQIKDNTVLLPARYQERIKMRPDIGFSYDHIEWVPDDEALIGSCESLVIAVPPARQYSCVKSCLAHQHITHLFLEKPIAPSPELASDLLAALIASGKNFRFGYNFRYTDWGKRLRAGVSDVRSLEWNFRAHHYANNIQTWKRQHEQGGGALRFYGIHLIALLSELGYSDVTYSELRATQQGDVEYWSAEFIGVNLSPCQIKVNSNADNTSFIIRDGEERIHSLTQPFQMLYGQNDSVLDQRIPYLVEGLTDLFADVQPHYEWYYRANVLWKNIEKRTFLP